MMATNRRAGYFLFVPIGVFASALSILSGDAQADGASWFATSKQNELAIVRYLLPTLKSVGKAGRVYYPASCPSGADDPVLFPKIDFKPPPKAASGLSAIKAMFLKNKQVSVTEDPPGIVRITVNNVSDAVLKTRISKVTLNPVSQYNEILAIEAIVGSVEVQSAMARLKIRVPLRAMDMPIIEPDERLTHLPPVIANVTMDGALDSVARTFHSIVLFGACADRSMYEVTATGGVYFDDSKLRN